GELLGVGAGLVAARGEGRLALGDLSEGVRGGGQVADGGRVGLGADDYEVVVHHVQPVDTIAGGHKLVFLGAGVHEHHVGVAAGAQGQRLAGADGDHIHAGAVLRAKVGQDGVEQAGVGRAGGGGQAQHGAAAADAGGGGLGGRRGGGRGGGGDG